MKTILIVGAGVAQKEGILRARDMGYRVVATDGSPDAPGLDSADAFRVIDVKDIPAHLALAEEFQIDGVLSIATDVSLQTVLAVREKFNLPGLSREPLMVGLNKQLQRNMCRKNGIAQPKFRATTEPDEVESIAAEIGYPLVVKPVDNAGSRGVSLVESVSELNAATIEAFDNSVSGTILLEAFVQGKELTVEGFSVDGEHHILAVSEKMKPEETPCVATELAYPAQLTSGERTAVELLMKGVYDAAGVDHSPTHAEVILTPNGPYFLEMGCRGGGFYVFTRVVEAASGYDIVGNWVRLAAGDPIEPVVARDRGVILRFMIGKPGVLNSVRGLEAAAAIDGVDVGSFFQVGEFVPEFSNDGSRTGWMIVKGEGLEDAKSKADIVSSLVLFDTEIQR